MFEQDDEAKLAFLGSIKNGLKKWPGLLPQVLTAINAGVQAHIAEVNARAMDCETLAVMAMARRTKNTDQAVLANLKKLNGRSWCRWDEKIKELEEKCSPKTK